MKRRTRFWDLPKRESKVTIERKRTYCTVVEPVLDRKDHSGEHDFTGVRKRG